jgi:hypothetical protein
MANALSSVSRLHTEECATQCVGVREATIEELKAAHCWEKSDAVPRRPGWTAYRRSLRLRQARWRESRGFPIGYQPMRGGPGAHELGSRMELRFARRTLSNFLSEEVKAAVQRRLAQPQRHQNLGKDRLMCDLLSSMPLAFNLFGELADDPGCANAAVHSWWPDTKGRVEDVIFEWSPGRLDPHYLGDKTAFDVAFLLRLRGGGQGIIGVEVKYHEWPEPEEVPKLHKLRRYLDVTADAGIFDEERVHSVIGSGLQQIWRDHLLALSMLQHPDRSWHWARYVLVYPSANDSFTKAAEEYSDLLQVRSSFESRTVERLLDADVLSPELTRQLRRRYLGTS